jgi:hypothetical protein
MREMAAGGDGAAHQCWRMAVGSAARVVRSGASMDPRTPLGILGDSTVLAESRRKPGWERAVLGCRSLAIAKIGRRARLIREKIIGHNLPAPAPGVGHRTSIAICRGAHSRFALLAGRGTLTLLHQPTRQHGRGVLFEPGIEQLSDLLAEIGRMAQTREFVTLQGITGRRQKKLPGRLGFVIQGDLQGKKPDEITSIVNIVKSIQIRTYCGKVCKSLACGREQESCANSATAVL